MGSGYFDKIRLIPEEDRYRIETSYLRSIDKISLSEFVYIDSSIERKLYITENSPFKYIKEIGQYYKKIYAVLQNHRKSIAVIEEGQAKAIGAALLYFINPYDYFPDFMPDLGYCDDLYVLCLCLEKIGNKDILDLLMKQTFED